MQTKGISKQNFDRLPEVLARAGRTVIAPVRDGEVVTFGTIGPDTPICLDEINTRLSIKDRFFPRTEPLLTFRRTESGIEMSDPDPTPDETIILGARGCDAASLLALDALFNWDFRDEAYNHRRENTTVISIACNNCDACCFCTSVGGSPHNTAGSDIMLSKTRDGGYLVEILTQKGEALAAELAGLLSDAPDETLPYAEVPVKFDAQKVRSALEGNFDSPLWAELACTCLSCGCCTYVCPNCHCFDMHDEAGKSGGARIRTWDSCQFPLFTKHTSGHNPRPTQASRWRQRIQHKFNYYPQKFNCVSCVGCGRCIRLCPVGIDISEHLARIENEATELPVNHPNDNF